MTDNESITLTTDVGLPVGDLVSIAAKEPSLFRRFILFITGRKLQPNDIYKITGHYSGGV
jgi:hypothetical protein